MVLLLSPQAQRWSDHGGRIWHHCTRQVWLTSLRYFVFSWFAHVHGEGRRQRSIAISPQLCKCLQGSSRRQNELGLFSLHHFFRRSPQLGLFISRPLFVCQHCPVSIPFLFRAMHAYVRSSGSVVTAIYTYNANLPDELHLEPENSVIINKIVSKLLSSMTKISCHTSSMMAGPRAQSQTDPPDSQSMGSSH